MSSQNARFEFETQQISLPPSRASGSADSSTSKAKTKKTKHRPKTATFEYEPSTISPDKRMARKQHVFRHVDIAVSNSKTSVSSTFHARDLSPTKPKRSRPSSNPPPITHPPSPPSLQLPFVNLDPLEEFEIHPSSHDHFVAETSLEIVPATRKRAQPSERPIIAWFKEESTAFLDEMMHWEGTGSGRTACGTLHCCEQGPFYRCKDCVGGALLCKSCTCSVHAFNPLHRIEKWSGDCFVHAELRDLGVHLYLGHTPGIACPSPIRIHSEFVIVSLAYQQTVSIFQCGCEHATVGVVPQLLRYGLFPATFKYPKTAATFSLLNYLELASLESKTSSFDLYRSILRSTDNTGLRDIPDRYDELRVMMREWSVLKMMKRAGRAYREDGERDPTSLNLVVECPACPHPGRNIDTQRARNPTHEGGWMDSTFIAIDGNFNLKQKDVMDEFVDPALTDEGGVFVRTAPYHEYLRTYDPSKEPPEAPCECRSHEAINDADTKDSKGLVTTGVVAVVDSRHDFFLPSSMGDLQKGERYRTTDYVFWTVVSLLFGLRIVVSYDIGCQWHKNLFKRLQLLPHELRSKLRVALYILTYLVPKFHLPVHVEICRELFAFSRTLYTGRTDGEAPERGWSMLDLIASMTKEMGPGYRRDTITKFCSDSNWKKTTRMGESLLRRLRLAVVEAREHRESHAELTLAMPASELGSWKLQVEAWEADHTQPNPYVSQNKDNKTESAIRLVFSREENQATLAGSAVPVSTRRHTPLTYITEGMNIEEQQRRLLRDSEKLGVNATDLQLTRVLKEDTLLRNRITAWFTSQQTHCPAAYDHRQKLLEKQLPGTPPPPTHALVLFLPSQLTTDMPCSKKLQKYEWELRIGRCHDSLNEIRSFIRARDDYYRIKGKQITGQDGSTRTQAFISEMNAKIRFTADRYRMSRNALAALAQVTKETVPADLKVLDASHLRSLPIETDERAGSKANNATPSWIWKAPGAGAGSVEAMRMDWCVSRSRMMRWTEEMNLLREEMRRTKAFHRWAASNWNRRANSYAHSSAGIEAGLRAYAHRQSSLREGLAGRCEELWEDVPDMLEFHGHSQEDIQHFYLEVAAPSTDPFDNSNV